MDWLGCFAIPLMWVTIAFALLLIGVTIPLMLLERHKPGQWVNTLEIVGCLYMIALYLAKLMGLSPYDPVGLVEGILPMTTLLVISVWHRVYEIVIGSK